MFCDKRVAQTSPPNALLLNQSVLMSDRGSSGQTLNKVDSGVQLPLMVQFFCVKIISIDIPLTHLPASQVVLQCNSPQQPCRNCRMERIPTLTMPRQEPRMVVPVVLSFLFLVSNPTIGLSASWGLARTSVCLGLVTLGCHPQIAWCRRWCCYTRDVVMKSTDSCTLILTLEEWFT
jgi:hypothetical protein